MGIIKIPALVEGASLEWVDEGGAKHARYFGHWSDDSKQDAAKTTRNMRDELCVDGDALDLVEGLAVGGTVWKGTDGAAVTYRCGESSSRFYRLNYRLQLMLRLRRQGMVNGGLTGRRGVIKDFASSACAALSPLRRLTVSSGCNQQSGLIAADYWLL